MAYKSKTEDQQVRLMQTINTAVGANFRDTGRDSLSRKRRDYWERIHRKPFGNEEPGYSQYVSGISQDVVFKGRAYVVNPYNRDQRPIVKFGDEKTTEYINYIFRSQDYNCGTDFIDDAAFDGVAFGNMHARVYPEVRTQTVYDVETFEGSDEKALMREAENFIAALPDDVEVVGEPVVVVDEEEKEQVVTEAPAPANPLLLDQEAPEPQVEEQVVREAYVTVTVETKQVIQETFPKLVSVPSSEWFIYPDTSTVDQAQTKGRVTVVPISQLKMKFPDAPKQYGKKEHKSKKGQIAFWEELTDSTNSLKDELEWYSRWADINATFYTSYQFDDISSAKAGLGEKAIVVTDCEVWCDLEDKGESRLYSVVMAGNQILHCEEITETQFISRPLISIGSRTAGYGFVDLVYEDDIEVTTNYRMMSDAVKLSAHGHALVDTEQVMFEDWINREPGSEIRLQPDTGQSSRAPVEYITNPSIQSVGTGLQLIESFTQVANSATGTGRLGFQPHQQDDVGDIRMSTDSMNIYENQANLFLDSASKNFAMFILDCMVKMQNVAAIAKTTPLSLRIMGAEVDVDPSVMPIYRKGELNLAYSMTERQAQAEKSLQTVKMLMELTQALPEASAQYIKPEAGYEALREYFYNIGWDDPDKIVKLPDADGGPNAQMQAQMEQAVAEAREAGIQEGIQSAQAKLFEAQARREHVEADTKEAGIEKMAIEMAQSQIKLDDAKELSDLTAEEKAAKIAQGQENIDLQARRVDIEEMRAEEETSVRWAAQELDEKNSERELNNPEADLDT